MDKTLQEILTLLEKGTVEQRCAALLVLGALLFWLWPRRRLLEREAAHG